MHLRAHATYPASPTARFTTQPVAHGRASGDAVDSGLWQARPSANLCEMTTDHELTDDAGGLG